MAVDGFFEPLPEADGEFPVRRGKFIDVEVYGNLFASTGTFNNVTIDAATITDATISGTTTINDATINNATITNADIDSLAYNKIVAGTNPNTLTHSGTFNVSGDLNVTGSLDLGGDLTMGTGGVIAFASAAPRLVIDYDTYGSQDIVFESGHQYEYSKGLWNFTTADSAPFIYAQLALTGTYLGDATNRGSGNINIFSDYQNSLGETEINAIAYGNWDALVDIAAVAGSGDAEITITTTSTSGTTKITFDADSYLFSGTTEQAEFPDGTQSLPAITFSGDPDSGIYNLGGNDVGIVAGGTRRLRINATRIDCDNVSFLSHPVKSTTGDPTGQQNGDVYVNTADNKMRLYADGAWRDIVTW